MIAFRQILCPVDISEFSTRVLEHAVALGRWYGAEVTVLFVRPLGLPPALWFGAPTALPLAEPHEREMTAGAIRDYVRDATGADPEVLVSEGPVVAEILRVAGELPADLIVMGTHGAGGFERLLLGSVTEKTLRKAACPVLTVPRAVEGREPPHVTFGTIVCGVDRSAASRRALAYALSLAQEAGGRLVLVHAVEDLSEEDARFAGHFNTPECLREIAPEIRSDYEALVPEEVRDWCKLEVRVLQGKPYRMLLDVSRDTSADLIVVGTSGVSMPFGTTTQHVLRESRLPVLAVPPGPAEESSTAGPDAGRYAIGSGPPMIPQKN